ncbi:MAG: DUF262 domain-containing protein [Methylovulum sp.]|uniref:DUF262 domain-containing protein n=1 Tax=Methylovulum sp. TaxID=1916980 RepID=UPI00261234BE|nr:DUF262 domain-containing protein [Methylovulum sp.]MDD2723703.1 DUF262 domain-containing protein [Methylovulum sp.]MDD5123323.1 DUF262 domain-containing protein [Methylovulum sp.]
MIEQIIDEDLAIEETEEPEENEADVVAYEITSYPADITLQGYVDKWEKEQLIIPEFQREYVWDQVKASKLIESFLLGLPVPNVFLYQDRKTKKQSIIDGQQRIRSVIMFFTGDAKFKKLKNVLPKWQGKTYKTLEEADKNQLDDAVLRATVIQQLDPDDNTSIYKIFERLNTSSMALNPMEIRKCVYSGDFFTLLEELNKLDAWRSLLGQSKPDKRLKDVELLLRCLALKENWRSYKKPMKAFLNDYMASTKKFDAEKLLKIKNQFTETCSKLQNELIPKPFHLPTKLNYAALDSIFYAASENLHLPVIQANYDALIHNSEYLGCVRQNTSDVEELKKRFELALNAFING